MRELKAYFRALSDGARLRIVAQLAGGEELNVSQLAKRLKMSQPLVSWHLRRLRKIGLVRVKREGRQTRCSLDRKALEEYRQEFAKLLGET